MSNQTLGARAAIFLATGCGVGFSPVAPGTVGALLGIPLAWGVAQLPGVALQGAVIVLVAIAGIPICTRAAAALGKKDPGSIVLDEIASLPMTFFLIPLSDWRVVVAGYLLHRLFDITKPPPARQLERLPDGLGIMADDWIAGLYSNLSLRLLIYLGVL